MAIDPERFPVPLVLSLILSLTAGHVSGQEASSGLRDRLSALEISARSLSQPTGKLSEAVHRTNYPLLMLKIEKARFLLDKQSSYWKSYTKDAEFEIREGEVLLRLLKENRLAYDNATGWHERAYISEADGSAQPFWVYLPRSYTQPEYRDRRYPVMVFLHGYDTSLTKADPWTLSQSILELADQRGYIVAVPYGRRNTDFVSIGEVDVLAVIAELQRLFRVDADRVCLIGVSMGGYGAYTVGLHYPDLFAAIMVVSGRTDHYFWQKLERPKVAGFKQWLIDADNPLTLVENARNLPILIVQGGDDSLVDIRHSRRMAATLKDLGLTYQFDELKNEDHWIYFGTDCYERAFNWFDKHRRDLSPKVITHHTFSPKYGRAYWAEITAFERWGNPAEVRAEVTDGNTIELMTDNVKDVVIHFPTPRLDEKKPVTLRWNGKVVYEGKIGNPGQWSSAEATVPTGVHKAGHRWGPIKEVFNGPHILVFGTKGTDRSNTRLQNNAVRMAEEWSRFADGVPTIKPDSEVTEEDIERFNLVLFGDENQNEIVARLREQLPFTVKEGEYAIAGNTYRGDDIGFMMVYPNPLNSGRSVLIQSGLFWGDALPINHKFDLLPDYIVYNDKVDYSDKTNEYLVAGFFDTNWKLDETLIWRRDKR